MKKHRKIVLVLGLVALLGLSAPELRAETITLSIFLNGSSTPIFSVTSSGTNAAQSLAASPSAVNTALAGTGYTFSSLSASSDFPGTTGSTGGYLSDTGNLTLAPGSTGGSLKIVVTESGFTAPASGSTNTLTGAATAIYSGASAASTQTYTGNFVDSSSVNVTTSPTITQTSTGAVSNVHFNTVNNTVPVYVTPYTLTNTTTISLTTSGSSNANDVFTGKTSIVAATVVPEPASLVMMVTGMPLPLVVMGLLRRRRAAA